MAPSLVQGLAVVAPGVRRVRRPADRGTPALDLAYVRSGPHSDTPIVVVPGGPGLASVVPYRGFRRRAARLGLDLIMVEHRGIGFSRTDVDGRDLPVSAMWVDLVVDDIVAVLDAEGIDSAYLVGSSYGSYVVSAFAARFPQRVTGMVLDSALQSADDVELERHAIRTLFWDADTPIAEDVRRLHEHGTEDRVLLDVVRAAYELGGDDLLGPLLRERLGRSWSPTWRSLESYASRDASIARLPAVYEFDLAGVIGFRELRYAPEPDGLPLDPALTYSPIAHLFPAFQSEPVDLGTAVADFHWPLVVLTGTRDLRTPTAVAERVAETAPDATLVRVPNGHSVLENHPEVLLRAVTDLLADRHRDLPDRFDELAGLPHRGLVARTPQILTRLVTAGQRS